jgi:hypothetical protein
MILVVDFIGRLWDIAIEKLCDLPHFSRRSRK